MRFNPPTFPIASCSGSHTQGDPLAHPMKTLSFRSPRPAASAPGYTLTEMLVTIVIVAVLAAIMVTVVRRVQEQAVTTDDIAKFRQVGMAIASIAQDNNGIIPHGNPARDSQGNFLYPGAAIPGTDAGTGDRYNFHEMVDRFFPPPTRFNPNSIYNYQTRSDANNIFSSKAAKPWQGFQPGSSFKLPGPLWFSFNRNLPNPKWAGSMHKVPDPSRIVICGETNHIGGDMQPQHPAVFADNVQTRYRVSRAGRNALYLFLDGHVEKLQGDRGEAFYAANPDQRNIWKWW